MVNGHKGKKGVYTHLALRRAHWLLRGRLQRRRTQQKGSDKRRKRNCNLLASSEQFFSSHEATNDEREAVGRAKANQMSISRPENSPESRGKDQLCWR